MSKPRQVCRYFNAIINRMHRRIVPVSHCYRCGLTTDMYYWSSFIDPCPDCGAPPEKRTDSGAERKTGRVLAKWTYHKHRSPLRWFRLNRSLDERDGYWEVLGEW